MSAPGSIVLTAKVGLNADLIPDVARLYLKGGRVADVTYGKGNFWKQIDTSAFEFFPSDISTGVDCRALPYPDADIDIVVFDPPYIYNPKDTVKASLSNPYRVNESGAQGMGLTTTSAVLDLYRSGMQEAFRVLKQGGFLLVKCQDQIEAGKQKWMHIDIFNYAVAMGFYAKDLFVLVQKTQPTIRWPIQKHARKNHSYLWVLEKKK